MKRTLFYALSEESDTMRGPQESDNFPPSYLVLRFSRDFHPGTLAWFIKKVQSRRRDGGAELLARRQPNLPNKGTTIHISASEAKVLEVAEEMEFRKLDSSGLVREFVLTQLEDFLIDNTDPNNLFTDTERISIVSHELENIRCLSGESKLPNYVQVLTEHGFVEKCFSLHDKEALKRLGSKWYMAFFDNQPYEEIRLYFGESIALYFIFLGFYTTALIIPMILGFIQLLIPHTTTVFFCVFNVISVTLFLELWKRKSNEFAFKWGTIDMTSLDEPRPQFRGEIAIDAVTGRYQRTYPRWKTNFKMYCVSLPICIICVIGAFFIMLGSFWAEGIAYEWKRDLEVIVQKELTEDGQEREVILGTEESYFGSILVNTPSIIYTILIYTMNLQYRHLATYLTEWENHRTQPQFERHRVTKLVIFEFINNFMSLFYIAFVMRDMENLKTQLATMLIVLQALNNLQETVVPLFIRRYGKQISLYFSPAKEDKLKEKDDGFWAKTEEYLSDVPLLPEDDPRIQQAIKEGKKEVYEGTYDDYLELFIQFGYVFLFSSVYPIAAAWAVLNNFFEIRSDAFKLCRVCRRPMPRRVKDIGAWQRAFDAVGAISIMTNCGLMCLSSELRNSAPNMSPVEWVLFFLFFEHFLLFLRYVLHIAIPEKPQWVRIAMQKIAYQSKQALKHERMIRNQEHLNKSKL